MKTLIHLLIGILPFMAFGASGMAQNPPMPMPSEQAGKTDEGYEIRVKLRNYPDSMQHSLRLGRYYWSGRYIEDSAVYDESRDLYVFQGDKALNRGMYILITADDHYVDFILDHNQHFGIEASYPELSSGIHFTNSPENEAYQEFIRTSEVYFPVLDSLQSLYKSAQQTKNEAETARLRDEISYYYQQVDEAKRNFTETYPDNMMAVIFQSQQPVSVPDAPASVPDSLKAHWQYEYYKNHYFDHFDLCDERLLFSPMLYQRVSSFQDKVLHLQSPDTIKFAWERLIEKARCNKEVFKALIAHPVEHYQRSQIIGQDAIWVYLAKKYYLGGEAWWASPSLVENFRKRIERVEPLLIGNRPLEFSCPDTTVDSPHENWVSVFSSNRRYTVVIFWSLSCVHCQHSMPKWHDLYEKHGKEWDFDVIAICKDHEVEEWKHYIRKHDMLDWTNLCGKKANLDYDDKWDVATTPTIYVLDSKKRIVTKMIEPEYLEDFIKDWNKKYF